jgi:hypothetical protein
MEKLDQEIVYSKNDLDEVNLNEKIMVCYVGEKVECHLLEKE